MNVQARHAGASVFELAYCKHNAISDQSPEYGGEGLGPMPTEYLLWSIAACFGQSVLFVAGKMRKKIEGLTLDVRANKDLSQQRFEAVTITVGCTAFDAPLEKILQLAKQYCFVTNSLSIPVHCIIEKNQYDVTVEKLRAKN